MDKNFHENFMSFFNIKYLTLLNKIVKRFKISTIDALESRSTSKVLIKN